MKQLWIFLILMLLCSPAHADVHVFACEPEWASLASEIGGEKVTTDTATTARQDAHHMRAKPSLLAAMRRADLVFCTGAGLEIGWLPLLLEKAGGASVQPGQPGYLEAARFSRMLEVPQRIDRAEGDVHPEGNPHLHLDPGNIARVAEELEKRLSQLDPANAAHYRQRARDFSLRWRRAAERWQKEAKELRGMPVIVHHRSFSYLIDWLDMREAGSLEPKPGIPPTTGHLEMLLVNWKTQPAQAILRSPSDPEGASRWLAEKTGAPALLLPYTVGGDEQSGDLFALYERTLQLLKEARHER